MHPVDEFRPFSYAFALLLFGVVAVAVVSATFPGGEPRSTAKAVTHADSSAVLVSVISNGN